LELLQAREKPEVLAAVAAEALRRLALVAAEQQAQCKVLLVALVTKEASLLTVDLVVVPGVQAQQELLILQRLPLALPVAMALQV
jgi:hypothetical protein